MAVVLKSRVLAWMESIDAMEFRERILLLAAVTGVIFLLADTLFLQPTLKQQQAAQQQITDLNSKLNGLRQSALLLNNKPDNGPMASRHLSREQLVDKLAQLEQRIINQLDTLIEPAQTTQLLEQVLNRHSGIKLTTLNASTEPLENINLQPYAEAPRLARYQITLVLQGDYLDILAYLKNLEAMPWKFFWQEIDFQSSQSPYAETRIRLYTLKVQGA